MSKLKPKMYAEALVDLVVGKKSEEIPERFFKLLEKNEDLKKVKEIVRLAEILYLKKIGKEKVILETARKIITKDILKKMIKKGDIVEEKINPELIAGIKVIIDGEKQLDFSLSKKLNDILI